MGAGDPEAQPGNASIGDDSPQPTTLSSQSSGVEIQHLPVGGEGGKEGHNVKCIGSESLGEEDTDPGTNSNRNDWAIILLNEIAENALVSEVERDLRRLAGDNRAKIFFPAITLNGFFLKDNPYANYVFVSSAMSDPQLLKFEKSRFVDCVLCIPGGAGRWRKVSKLTDADLEGMKPSEQREESEIEPGDEVKIISGDWAGLQGTLYSCFGSQVKVLVQLRSKQRLLVLTRQEIEKI